MAVSKEFIGDEPVAIKPYRTYGTGRSQITIFHGDSLELMPTLNANSVDVVVTSPPYNIGINYTVHRDNLPRPDYMEWMSHFGSIVSDVLRKDGSFFLNVGGTPEDPWLPWDVARAVSGELSLQNVIHWVKSISVDDVASDGSSTVLSAGHFKPISSRRFLNDCHEYIFHFTHDGRIPIDKLAVGVPYKDKSNIGRWKSVSSDLRDRGNLWFIPYETIRSKQQRPHPATFPVRLPEMCILLHGVREGMAVVDPFMGIGSTALACARLGVSFTGYDIDSSYLEESCSRLENYFSGRESKPEQM